jgi:hypothetical protein
VDLTIRQENTIDAGANPLDRGNIFDKLDLPLEAALVAELDLRIA